MYRISRSLSGRARWEQRRQQIVVRKLTESGRLEALHLRHLGAEQTKHLPFRIDLSRLIGFDKIMPATKPAGRSNVEVTCAPGGRLNHHTRDAAKLLAVGCHDVELREYASRAVDLCGIEITKL